jgi:N-acetylated-alpha-linked acidic dipeptidase
LDARIDEIPVLLSYPIERQVQVVYPSYLLYNCSLEEAVVDDGTSGVPGAIPTWNGYSGSGDVTGDLVYANYGREEDYQALVARNVSFTGKVVIVRYGQIFRGNKAQLAAELGAVAVLIYVDPSDSGLFSPLSPASFSS